MLHKKCDAVVRDLEQRGDRWEVRATAAEAALRELLEILPDYMGLAVYLNDDERTQFHIAESGVMEAMDEARDALKGDEAK